MIFRLDDERSHGVEAAGRGGHTGLAHSDIAQSPDELTDHGVQVTVGEAEPGVGATEVVTAVRSLAADRGGEKHTLMTGQPNEVDTGKVGGERGIVADPPVQQQNGCLDPVDVRCHYVPKLRIPDTILPWGFSS